MKGHKLLPFHPVAHAPPRAAPRPVLQSAREAAWEPDPTSTIASDRGPHISQTARNVKPNEAG